MDKRLLALYIFVSILLLGFLIAFLMPGVQMCTQMGCPCDLNPGKAELQCYGCTSYDPLFFTGVINIQKVCPMQEVIMCEQEGKIRYDARGECKTTMKFFSFR
jgi:hypothetical protein